MRKFKTEVNRLLHLIIHSLYSHPEIFLRELISNASDALNRVRYEMLVERDVLDPDAELNIRISFNDEETMLTCDVSGDSETESLTRPYIGGGLMGWEGKHLFGSIGALISTVRNDLNPVGCSDDSYPIDLYLTIGYRF